MTVDYRPETREPVLQGLFGKIRDAEKIAPHGQKERLVFFLRPTGRVLRCGDKTGRSGLLHSKLSRASSKTSLSSHGLERQSIRILHVNETINSLLTLPTSCKGASNDAQQKEPQISEMEGASASPVPRRLSFSFEQQETSTLGSSTCRKNTQTIGFITERKERFLGTSSSFRTLGARNRYLEGRISSAAGEAGKYFSARAHHTGSRSPQSPVGAGETARLTGGKSSISLSGNSGSALFLTRGAQCNFHQDQLVGSSKTEQSSPKGLAMVGNCSHDQQWSFDVSTCGDGVPSRRQLRLRVGGSTERIKRGAGFLVRHGSGISHHFQGAQSGPIRNTKFSPSLDGTERSPTRGQPSRGSGAHALHHALASNDGRASKIVVPSGHSQYSHPPAIHSQCGKRVGGRPEQGVRHFRLEIKPENIQIHRPALGSTHNRSLRFNGEPDAPALQLTLAGPPNVGGGQLAISRLELAKGKQLGKSSVGITRGISFKTATKQGGSDRGGPCLGGYGLVSGAAEPGFRSFALPTSKRPVLSWQARQARGSRDAKLERRDIPPGIPSWMTRRRSSIKKSQRTFGNFSISSVNFPVPKARQITPTYTVRPPDAEAPWSTELFHAYSPLVGEDKLGKFTLSLLASAKERGTYKSYSSNFNRFVEFCNEENPPIHPLEANVGTICRYIGWQGLRGTVGAANLQPCLSAINRIYKDCGL